MEKIKVALVHDWLTGQRGGEKVLEVFSEIFPDAPIYTLIHFEGTQVKEIEEKEIRTSFIQKMPFLKKKYRFYLPLFPLAIELFDLQEYDLILSSSHCVARGVIPRPDALHISYIHSPMRYAWNHYFSYFAPDHLGFFSRRLIPPVIHFLRIWDQASTPRSDYILANSKTVASRINKYYGRSAEVFHPPVDSEFFQPGKSQEDYYLIVSAFVPYKRIDLAIEAFNQNGKPLKIVGEGPDYGKLKKMARANVEFCGNLEARDLLQMYQGARALLMPGEEDFGITALESQCCGVPVIAYGRGGATETVISEETGLFFCDLAAESLLGVLDKFEAISFNRETIRANALKFSRDIFKEKISSFIRDKWSEHVSRQ